MSKGFPYLAMDSAGKRTVLCDYPVRMFERHEEKKMKIMSDEKSMAHAHRVIDRLLAHDADLDDEGKARVKEFLKNKLSAADHETLCSMLAGEVEPPDDVQTFNTGDTPPPLPGTPRPLGGMDGLSARQRMQAADSMINKRAQARDSFFAMFPDQAKIRIDNSGIQPRGRASSYSADGAASFAAMFPDAMEVRLL